MPGCMIEGRYHYLTRILNNHDFQIRLEYHPFR